MMKPLHRRVWLLTTAFAVLALLWWLVIDQGLILREHHSRSYDLIFADGRAAHAKVSKSHGRGFGNHAFTFGGARERIELTLWVDNETYVWRGTVEQPIVVNSVDGQIFLVLMTYSYRVNTESKFTVLVPQANEWREIPLIQLPREIAERNIGLGQWEALEHRPHLSGATDYLHFALEQARSEQLPPRP